MNFWKSLLLLSLWVIIWVSGTWIINYVGNYTIEDQEVPSIWSDAELVAGLRRKITSLDKQSCSERYKKFEDVFKILQENYYSASGVKFEWLLEWGLHGFVGWLKDSHTVYFDKQENDDFSNDLKGSYDFEWIGAVIGQSNDKIMIMEIIKWSPAYSAWLRPLDIILQIDAKSIDGLTVREVVNKVRGVKGTKVELTVYSDKEKKISKILVMRDTISIPSVYTKLFQINDKQIWYINISTIGEDTASKFKESYEGLVASGAKWFIIDLRWNGGGILPIANEIASYFIPKDKIVTITRYKSLPEEVYYSKWYGKKPYPIIVLVDELSASASEILAYALKYQAAAVLLGTTTYGKGTIQTLYTLPDNSSIKFTIWKRYTPDGLNVDKIGIKPSIELKFDPALFESKQIDNQLDKAKVEMIKMIK